MPGRVSDNYSLELAKLRAEVTKKKYSKAELKERVLLLERLIKKNVKQVI